MIGTLDDEDEGKWPRIRRREDRGDTQRDEVDRDGRGGVEPMDREEMECDAAVLVEGECGEGEREEGRWRREW